VRTPAPVSQTARRLTHLCTICSILRFRVRALCAEPARSVCTPRTCLRECCSSPRTAHDRPLSLALCVGNTHRITPLHHSQPQCAPLHHPLYTQTPPQTHQQTAERRKKGPGDQLTGTHTHPHHKTPHHTYPNTHSTCTSAAAQRPCNSVLRPLHRSHSSTERRHASTQLRQRTRATAAHADSDPTAQASARIITNLAHTAIRPSAVSQQAPTSNTTWYHNPSTPFVMQDFSATGSAVPRSSCAAVEIVLQGTAASGLLPATEQQPHPYTWLTTILRHLCDTSPPYYCPCLPFANLW
jgi:hypothetical protein